MARNTNVVMLTGNLTEDPSYVERGEHQFCDLRVAVNHGRKFADGSDRPANYFDIKTFGNTATACRDYLAKGKKVAIVGELRHETWETDDGSKRSKVTVAANSVEFLTPRDQNGAAPAAATATVSDEPVADEGDSDIPF